VCLKLLASSQIELGYICVEVDTREFKRPRTSRAVPARNDPLISSSAPDGHYASHATIVRHPEPDRVITSRCVPQKVRARAKGATLVANLLWSLGRDPARPPAVIGWSSYSIGESQIVVG
jgi:hypothetical protein